MTRSGPCEQGPSYRGIVFSDGEAGRSLFRKWIARHGNTDRSEALRIAIIEGPLPSFAAAPTPATPASATSFNPSAAPPAYVIHLCPDPLGLVSDVEAMTAMLQNPQMKLPSRICQANPLPSAPGQPSLLARFKEEYAKHKEFLFVPVTRRPDGKLWVDANLGIIKHRLYLHQAAEFNLSDPIDLDATALAAHMDKTNGAPSTPGQPRPVG